MNKFVATILLLVSIYKTFPCEYQNESRVEAQSEHQDNKLTVNRTASYRSLKCCQDELFVDAIKLLIKAHRTQDMEDRLSNYKLSFYRFLKSGENFINKSIYFELPFIVNFDDAVSCDKEAQELIIDSFKISEDLYQKIKKINTLKINIITSHLGQIINDNVYNIDNESIREKYDNFMKQISLFRLIRDANKIFDECNTAISCIQNSDVANEKFKKDIQIVNDKIFSSMIKKYLKVAEEYLNIFPSTIDTSNFKTAQLIWRLTEHALLNKAFSAIKLSGNITPHLKRKYIRLNTKCFDAYLKCIEFDNIQKKRTKPYGINNLSNSWVALSKYS